MPRKLKSLFCKKYLGYTIYIRDDDQINGPLKDEVITYDLDFYFDKNEKKEIRLNYPGFANSQDRKFIDNVLIKENGNRDITDLDINNEYKQIFADVGIG